MNDDSSDQPGVSPSPELPSKDRIRKALETAMNKRPRTVYRTIVLKLHQPGRRKERALLWAQAHATNMTAHILEALREEPGEVHYDRTLACIREMYSRKAQGQTGQRTQILADILSESFRGGVKRRRKRPKQAPFKRVTLWAKPGKNSGYRQKKRRPILKTKPARVEKLTSIDYPIAGSLRDGVFRQVALMLLNWYLRIIGLDEETEDEDSGSGSPSEKDGVLDMVPDIDQVHAIWAERVQRYQEASETLMSFGRHRGKTLVEVGKREARWLQERIIPLDIVEETVKHIDVLLNQTVSDEEAVRSAKRARHPWRRRSSLERVPRANRLVQRGFDGQQPLIRLEALSQDELGRLREELLEMRSFSKQFTAIRDAVDVFLSPAPPSYPTVKPIAVGARRHALVTAYEDALNNLQERYPSQATVETELIQTFLKRTSELEQIELQPLSFKRTMRPPQQRTSFALLYSTAQPDRAALERKYCRMPRARRDQKVAQILNEGLLYTYVLAIVVHGEGAFRGEDAAEQFAPTIRPGLFYVNYPETPFTASKGSSVLLFPLELGEKYQEQQFLRRVLEQQRELQHYKYQTALRSKGAKDLADCLPKAAIGSARVTGERTREGHYEFYLHLPIKTELTARPTPPESVLGVYEHSRGYSYAAMDLAGRLLSAGDVAIPEHVQPKEFDTSYSDNYVFETVKQIVSLAAPGERPSALIGIRPMDWARATVSLSRDQNRVRFRRPSLKVVQVLGYKALLAGLPKAMHVWSVSPRECSQCGMRREYGARDHKARTSECPGCSAQTLEISGDDELHCTTCDALWVEDELWFSCDSCGHRQAARLNTATVVARRTLMQIVERDDNASRKQTKGIS